MATDMARQRRAAPKAEKLKSTKYVRNGVQLTRNQYRVYRDHAAGKTIIVPEGKYCEACGRSAGRIHKKDCLDPCKLGDY